MAMAQLWKYFINSFNTNSKWNSSPPSLPLLQLKFSLEDNANLTGQKNTYVSLCFLTLKRNLTVPIAPQSQV